MINPSYLKAKYWYSFYCIIYFYLIAGNKNLNWINQLEHFIHQGIFYAFSSGHILFVKDFINYWYNALKKKKTSLKDDHKMMCVSVMYELSLTLYNTLHFNFPPNFMILPVLCCFTRLSLVSYIIHIELFWLSFNFLAWDLSLHVTIWIYKYLRV